MSDLDTIRDAVDGALARDLELHPGGCDCELCVKLREAREALARVAAQLQAAERRVEAAQAQINKQAGLGGRVVELENALRDIAEAHNTGDWQAFAEWLQDHARAATGDSQTPHTDAPECVYPKCGAKRENCHKACPYWGRGTALASVPGRDTLREAERNVDLLRAGYEYALARAYAASSERAALREALEEVQAVCKTGRTHVRAEIGRIVDRALAAPVEPRCPTCDGRGEVAAVPGLPSEGPMPCPSCAVEPREETTCGAAGPHGARCNRPLGHEGAHELRGGSLLSWLSVAEPREETP